MEVENFCETLYVMFILQIKGMPKAASRKSEGTSDTLKCWWSGADGVKYPPHIQQFVLFQFISFFIRFFLYLTAFSIYFCYVSPRMASGMQEKQYTPSLLSFFIYNPKFGPREGEVSLSFTRAGRPGLFRLFVNVLMEEKDWTTQCKDWNTDT